MARRPRQEEERSMDSLMDAMTNVVGILLLILIVSSLQITAVVKEILENMPEISEEQLEDMKESHQKTLANLEDIRTTKDDVMDNTISPEEAVQLAVQIENIEKENQDLADMTNDLAEWQKKIKELTPQEEERRERNELALAELKKLEEALAAKDPIVIPPSREIKVPDPKPIKGDETVYYFACKHEKLYIIGDPYQKVIAVRDVLDKSYKQLAYTGGAFGEYSFAMRSSKKNDRGHLIPHMVDFRARTRSAKEALAYLNNVSQKSHNDPSVSKTMFQYLFGMNEEQQESKKEWPINKLKLDKTKVTEFFKKNQHGRTDIDYHPAYEGDRIVLEMIPNPEKGLTKDQIFSTGSPYLAAIADIKRNSGRNRPVVIFHVAPDSFELYRDARDFVDRERIRAGKRLWTSSKLGKHDLKPIRKIEAVPYDLSVLPAQDYLAVSKACGPKVAASYDKILPDFKADDPSLKIPEKKNLGTYTPETYKAKLIEDRERWLRDSMWRATNLYKTPLAATQAKREDVVPELHPPYVMFQRAFDESKPPTSVHIRRPPPGKGDKPAGPVTPTLTTD